MNKTLKYILRGGYQFFIKTGAGRFLLKQVISIKYIKMNSAALSSKCLKTPWVCEFPYNKNQCVAYINEVFNDYFVNSGLDANSILGKTILEIGPGENLGVALRFLAAGAARVVCIDRFNSLLGEEMQTEVYRTLFSGLQKSEQENLKDVISFCDGTFRINTAKLEYLNVSAENLDRSFPPLSFDLIVSRAVLEHVLLIEPAMEAMHKMLKPGGFMLHEVDFRDHGIFTNYKLPPLTFLSLSTAKWIAMTSNLGAPNRRMLGYYKSFFIEKGYLLDFLILRLFNSDTRVVKLKELSEEIINTIAADTIQKQVHPSCRIKGSEDLLAAAAFFCAKKNR